MEVIINKNYRQYPEILEQMVKAGDINAVESLMIMQIMNYIMVSESRKDDRFLDKNGYRYAVISNIYMAESIGVSVRTVTNINKNLVKENIIKTVSEYINVAGGIRQKCTKYYIMDKSLREYMGVK